MSRSLKRDDAKLLSEEELQRDKDWHTRLKYQKKTIRQLADIHKRNTS
jgi:hypothetical protein